jgi:bacterioferritin-associated ferredoxin
MEDLRLRERDRLDLYPLGGDQGMRSRTRTSSSPPTSSPVSAGSRRTRSTAPCSATRPCAAIDDYLERNGKPSLRGQEAAEVICTCLNVTDRDIEEAYKAGDRTWEDLQARTKIGTACGGCRGKAMELLHQLEHLYGE